MTVPLIRNIILVGASQVIQYYGEELKNLILPYRHIQGSQHQQNDFEAAADFLLVTAPKPKDQVPGHRISAAKFNPSKKKTIGDTGVELRYYSSHEYNNLLKAQKKELGARRNDKENYNPPSHNISALQQQIAQMKKETEAMRATIAACWKYNINLSLYYDYISKFF